MGRRRARFNQKARASSHLTQYAVPHANPRHRGNVVLRKTGGEGGAVVGVGAGPGRRMERDASVESAAMEVVEARQPITTQAHIVDFNAHPESAHAKAASKKKKRFEKYVERQLKKEEHTRLLKKLAESAQDDTKPSLLSTKHLGRAGVLTTKERAEVSLGTTDGGVVQGQAVKSKPKAKPKKGTSKRDRFSSESDSETEEHSDEGSEDDESFLSDTMDDDDDDNPSPPSSSSKTPHRAAEVVVFSGSKTSVEVDDAGRATTETGTGKGTGTGGINPAKIEFASALRKQSAQLAAPKPAEKPSVVSEAVKDGNAGKAGLEGLTTGLVFGGALKRKVAGGQGGKKEEGRSVKKPKVEHSKDVASEDEDMEGSASEDGEEEASDEESEEEDRSSDDGMDVGDQPSTRTAGKVTTPASKPPPTTIPAAAPPPTSTQPKPPPDPKPITMPDGPITPANLPTSLFLSPITTRPPHIIQSRQSDPLPILHHESAILDALLHHPVTVLVGATGSGKTTQVPQMALEFGFGNPEHPLFPGMVAVTEPRRVAAVSVARRVREEMGLDKLDGPDAVENAKSLTPEARASLANSVGWAVRYDRGGGREGKGLRLKFVTEGVLLRELSLAATSSTPGAGLLPQYSCVILDETHVRTAATDVLLGWLARVAAIRNHPAALAQGVKPLRVVVMSATMDVAGLMANPRLFSTPPPVVSVEGRRFRVTVHYNRKTPVGGGDGGYLGEALRKVGKVHETLPQGGVLVFVTGKAEVEWLCRELKEKYGKKKGRGALGEQDGSEGGESAAMPTAAGSRLDGALDEGEDNDVLDDSLELDDPTDIPKRNRGKENEWDGAESGDGEESEEEDVEEIEGESGDEGENGVTPGKGGKREALSLHVLPLYSMLPPNLQQRVFQPPPPGTRHCIVATNVAETSLTIPDVKYVIDTGKVKERSYDPTTGLQRFVVTWTSQSAAEQRAGRAGRTTPGHCYRLYSSAVFANQFQEFDEPEIARTPVDSVVLQMKAMGISHVDRFPFPTPPDSIHLRQAESLLAMLGALQEVDAGDNQITPLGKLISQIPVGPRFGRMLALAGAQGGDAGSILSYIIAIVAGMTVGDPLLAEDEAMGLLGRDADASGEGKEERSARKKQYWKAVAMFSGKDPTSDHLRLLSIIGAYEHHRFSTGNTREFCERYFLRPKVMEEIGKLRKQLTDVVKLVFGTAGTKGGDDGVSLASALDDTVLPVLPALRAASKSLALDPRMPPPSPKQRAMLREIVFSGFADQIAHLVPAAKVKALPGINPKSALARLPTYEPLTSPNFATIHHLSVIFHVPSAPVLVCYTDLTGRDERTGVDGETIENARGELKDPSLDAQERMFLKGVTVVEEEWLARAGQKLRKLGRLIGDREPWYDASKDAIVGMVGCTYGAKEWPAGTVEYAFPKPPGGGDAKVQTEQGVPGATAGDSVRWFARYLLEGKVVTADGLQGKRPTAGKGKSGKHGSGGTPSAVDMGPFGMLEHLLVAKPSSITKQWSKTLARVAEFVSACGKCGASREGLVAMWKTNPQFLLREFLPWVPQALHAAVTEGWPFVRILTKTSPVSGSEVLKPSLDHSALKKLEKAIFTTTGKSVPPVPTAGTDGPRSGVMIERERRQAALQYAGDESDADSI